MNLKGNGILLFVNNYQECVEFYRDQLELPVIFSEENVLTTFDFGGAYLMVEPFNILNINEQKQNNCTYLRFDVDNDKFEEAVEFLSSKQIQTTVNNFDWGKTAAFTDPDGTKCEIYAPLANMPDNFTKR